MCLPPGSWQTYDISFRAARFDDDGKRTEQAQISVSHNGVLVHKNYLLKNKTGAGKPEAAEPLPIWFQNHRDPVEFRNIWIVNYEDAPATNANDLGCRPCRYVFTHRIRGILARFFHRVRSRRARRFACR